MLYFAADDHYNSNPGKMIYEEIKDRHDIKFSENDWSIFSEGLADDCDLLILNMIADTCGLEKPDAEAEKHVKAYCEKGGNILLLHGGSAAFWHWDWWRPIVGYRWVRPNDPDQVEKSTHPVRPYKVNVSKTRHPLCGKLKDMDLPEDEIYTSLEQTCPAMVLMETTTDEGTFAQCYENITPWGGKIVGFIPGHRESVTRHPDLVHNVNTLIEYLQDN
jgi:hypothetical protein